jgi:hypothetical protein
MDYDELIVPQEELRQTPTVDDIREWGRQNGYDVPDSGRLPKGLRSDFNKQNGFTPMTSETRLQEQPPNVEVEHTPAQRIRGAISRRSKAPTTTSRKPKQPRVSTENVISGFWSLMSLVVKPISLPAAKAFAMEAPVAGMILDDQIRGTFTDRVLQPLARAESQGKTFGALMAPPLLVMAIDKYPARAEMLLPMLRKSLVWHIQVAGPKIEQLLEDEREFEEKYGQDINTMIMSFFAVPEDTEES